GVALEPQPLFMSERCVAQSFQFGIKHLTLCFKSLHDRSKQHAVAHERMSAAVESGFDAKLRHPQPLLGKQFTLDEGRPVVADFENDALGKRSVTIGKEIVKLLKIPIETWVKPRR